MDIQTDIQADIRMDRGLFFLLVPRTAGPENAGPEKKVASKPLKFRVCVTKGL